MVFRLPGYYNQPYAANLYKSFNDNYDEVFRVDNVQIITHRQKNRIIFEL